MNTFRLAAAADRCGCAVARLAIVAVVAGLSVFDRPAPAAIIIQDQFVYPAGSLNGQNGGQGFSAAWQATSDLQVTSPGLTYSTLETSGNAITGLNSGSMRVDSSPAMRQRAGIDLLPIGETEACQIHKLPQLHRDPFDRILVAQAACHGLAIVTDDAWIGRYPVRTLW